MTKNSPKLFIFITALLLASPCANAFGQFRDVPPKYEEFGIVCLLGFPSVIDHLKADYELSEDRAKSLQELGRNRLKNMHRRRDFRMKTSKMSDDEFSEARTELFDTIQKSNNENWTKAKELLTEKQIARLKELRIQRLGPAALMDAEVIQALDIKEDQLEQYLTSAMTAKKAHDKALRKLESDLFEKPRDMNIPAKSQAARDYNMEMAKKLADAKIAKREKVFKTVLTKEQQAKLDSLTGEPFVFKLDFNFPRINVDWQTDPLRQTASENSTSEESETKESMSGE